MPKITNGYCLSPDLIEWLRKKAIENDRSASYVLDKIVRSAKDADRAE